MTGKHVGGIGEQDQRLHLHEMGMGRLFARYGNT